MIVLCSGCFAAITHAHIRYLEAAAFLAPHGKVWVAIASAKIIAQLKPHQGRAIPDNYRGQMLIGLPFVQSVIIQDEPTPESIIRKLRPSLWVKGGDYDPNKLAELPEGKAVRECGGQIVCTNHFSGPSTTELLKCVNGSLT